MDAMAMPRVRMPMEKFFLHRLQLYRLVKKPKEEYSARWARRRIRPSLSQIPNQCPESSLWTSFSTYWLSLWEMLPGWRDWSQMKRMIPRTITRPRLAFVFPYFNRDSLLLYYVAHGLSTGFTFSCSLDDICRKSFIFHQDFLFSFSPNLVQSEVRKYLSSLLHTIHSSSFHILPMLSNYQDTAATFP